MLLWLISLLLLKAESVPLFVNTTELMTVPCVTTFQTPCQSTSLAFSTIAYIANTSTKAFEIAYLPGTHITWNISYSVYFSNTAFPPEIITFTFQSTPSTITSVTGPMFFIDSTSINFTFFKLSVFVPNDKTAWFTLIKLSLNPIYLWMIVLLQRNKFTLLNLSVSFLLLHSQKILLFTYN